MKKIMFNDRYGLTNAVLEGRKTMTRRVLPKRFRNMLELSMNPVLIIPLSAITFKEVLKYSTYKVGEVVAVAQSYKDTGNYPEAYIIDEFHPNIEFEAGWNNKMFVRAELMPHQIRITGIKVERLRDITSEDCLNEGIEARVTGCHTFYYIHGEERPYNFPKQAFSVLIDKISGKGTWDRNPWVFVYEFELVK